MISCIMLISVGLFAHNVDGPELPLGDSLKLMYITASFAFYLNLANSSGLF